MNRVLTPQCWLVFDEMVVALVVAFVVSLMSFATLSEATFMSSELFSLNINSRGDQVCVNGIPSETPFVKSKSGCALACAAQKECLQYNYFKKNSTCQLFYNSLNSQQKTADCTSYMNMVNNETEYNN